MNQQGLYRSINQVIHSNIRPDTSGLTITLRRSDIPASITHLRLTARQRGVEKPVTSCEIAYAIDAGNGSGSNETTESTTQFLCTPEKYGSVDVISDETSVHFLLTRKTHTDFFSSEGRMHDIDIEFKADYFATQPLN